MLLLNNGAFLTTETQRTQRYFIFLRSGDPPSPWLRRDKYRLKKITHSYGILNHTFHSIHFAMLFMQLWGVIGNYYIDRYCHEKA
jgi:hypothetical protein